MIWKPSLSFTSIISLEWFQLFQTWGFYDCNISWQLHSSFLRSMKSILELRHPISFQLLPPSANEMWKNNRRISVIMLKKTKKNLIRFLFWMPLNASSIQKIIDSNFGEFLSTYYASCTVSQKHESTWWLLACALHSFLKLSRIMFRFNIGNFYYKLKECRCHYFEQCLTNRPRKSLPSGSDYRV